MYDHDVMDYYYMRQNSYTGTAWNVFIEYGAGDEYWGHNGEYADELDAWFKTKEDAIAFADDKYPDELLIDMLLDSPDGDGADTISLCIREWEWKDGSETWDGDELFVTFKKNDGEIELEESYR